MSENESYRTLVSPGGFKRRRERSRKLRDDGAVFASLGPPLECSFGGVVRNRRIERGRVDTMAQPLNLLAREHFKTGDPGYVLGEGVRLGDGVRKLTDAGPPRGAIRVTALEDIEAWTNGQFQDSTPTRGQRVT